MKHTVVKRAIQLSCGHRYQSLEPKKGHKTFSKWLKKGDLGYPHKKRDCYLEVPPRFPNHPKPPIYKELQPARFNQKSNISNQTNIPFPQQKRLGTLSLSSFRVIDFFLFFFHSSTWLTRETPTVVHINRPNSEGS